MSNNLNIPSKAALDLVSLGALVHRLDPGIIPFPQGDDVSDPRQRRRIQRCGESRRLFRDEHRRLPPPWWSIRSAI